jgi:hypothetical protein
MEPPWEHVCRRPSAAGLDDLYASSDETLVTSDQTVNKERTRETGPRKRVTAGVKCAPLASSASSPRFRLIILIKKSDYSIVADGWIQTSHATWQWTPMHVNITRPKRTRTAGGGEEAVGRRFYRRRRERRWWSWLWEEARYTSGFSSLRSQTNSSWDRMSREFRTRPWIWSIVLWLHEEVPLGCRGEQQLFYPYESQRRGNTGSVWESSLSGCTAQWRRRTAYFDQVR